MDIIAFEELPKPHVSNTVMILHGILGSGRNWQGFGRLLAQNLGQSWKATMVDLRNHGKSSKIKFPPPHNLAAAAQDVANLIEAYPGIQPDILIGHSMGGRVALEFLRGCVKNCRNMPKQVWILDAFIGKPPLNEQHYKIEELISLLPSLPSYLPSKQWLMNRLLELGLSTNHAKWLASCAKRVHNETEECVWEFNPLGVTEMFNTCGEEDYWELLKNPPDGISIGIICGDRSDMCTESDKKQLELLAKEGKIVYKVLENAGHALHVDNPKGLVSLLTSGIN